MKNNSNITDNEFWDNKYYRGNPTYLLLDPYFGRNGLFHRKFGCFIEYNSNVLELGCGASKYLMFFKLIMGLETYGIDFSAEGIEKLNIMANKKGIEHNVVLGDFFEVDMDERKFDLIFHAGLMEHFKNPLLLVERCRFFCKDNGLMIFLIPNFINKAWSYHSKICPLNAAAHIRYSKENIEKALDDKFELVETGFWGYPQIYAGGVPEAAAARILQKLNVLIAFLISASRPKYSGCSNSIWTSTVYFVCKPK